MGDGGVACVPSQHVVERFPEAFCAGSGSNGNGFSSKTVQLADSNCSSSQQQQQQRKSEKNMEVEKEEFGLEKGQNGDFKKVDSGEGEKLQKGELEKEGAGLEKRRKGEFKKGDLVSEKGRKGKGEKLRKGEVEKGETVLENSRKGEIEKGEFVPERWQKVGEVEREEYSWEKVRRGEFKKGDSCLEKLRKGEVEKGEVFPGKWRKLEVEKGEIISDEWQKGEIEKGEFVPEKWRKEELEKGEFVPDKWRKGEVEKGEIVSERRRKGEVTKEEFGSGRGRRWEVEKGEFVPEKGRNRDRETPPSVKFTDEDFSQRNESSRSGSERRKRSSRWETTHERDSKGSSRMTDDESGLYKSEYGDEKNRGKDYTSGTWLKRHGMESESSSRRYPADCTDYLGSKSRRISDDTNHSSYSDKLHLRSSVESSYRNSSLSSRVSSSSRYTSRHYDSSSSSRGGHDRHGRSPGYSERSPHNRARYYDHRDRSPAHPSDRHGRSPGYSERSPSNRARHYDHRDRSPVHVGYSERSPHIRSRHHDHKDRSPVHSERSPRDRPRHRDHRDRTPLYLERSPHDRGRSSDTRETNRKTGGNEKHNSRYGTQGQEDRLGRRDSSGRDSHRHSTSKQLNNSTSLANSSSCQDKSVDDQSHKEKESQNQTVVCNEVPSQVSEAPEEFQSMEEDMDICDTPPHVPAVADSTLGKWFYLDHFGIEQGPSKLRDLRRLVEEGLLQSDHLIKHSESDRWVTVENAASPLVPVNLPSIVSDSETQLVNPPEAPGNLLVDTGDIGQTANQPSQESSILSLQPLGHLDESLVASESLEDLHIDERVGALLTGYTVIPGRELETLGEALQTMFEHAEWEKWGSSEGFSRSRPRSGESFGHPRDEEFGRGIESMHKETVETRFVAPPEKEYPFLNTDSSDWSSSLWSCKGGDWKRSDEATQDRSFRRKLVLNEGYPLCQMPKSGHEDPRWHRKDELYHPSRSRRLDLPPWAFTLSEEKNDINGDPNKNIVANRSSQLKPPLPLARGLKGIMLPVIRINACVVKDHGSFVSDTRSKVRGSERHTSRPVRPVSASSDSKGSFMDGVARSKAYERDLQLQALLKHTGANAPKDRVCTADELQLHLGDWYYLDGAGHEHGPSSFSELQSLVTQGIIQKHTSVFRKFDKVWVPITTAVNGSESILNQEGKVVPTADSSAASSLPQPQVDHGLVEASSSFHNLHPQFIGYMRGKLHELVMKSYRSREFSVAINEVLDPWMSAKQPKKETDKHFPFNSAITKSSSGLDHDLLVHRFRKSEDDLSGIYKDHTRSGKRARLLADESEDDDEMEEDLLTGQNDSSFEDLCSEISFGQEITPTPQTETESWGLLNGRILARVFHYLRMDLKSLATSAATCKCWNTAVKFYRDISQHVDLSSVGPNCTDSMFQNIMSGYDKLKITSIVLMGCTNVSAGALEEVLLSFPSICSVDVRGCSQFRELRHSFKNVKWISSHGSRYSKMSEESYSKMRSLKQITEKSYSNYKAFRGSSSHLDDSSEVMDSFDYYSSLDRRDSANHAFRQSCYKRTKLLNARKTSSVLSRDAHMRRWLRRKSENGYKMMEEFLALSLKDIMKENTCQFFIPKVAEIEERMRNGYYIGHGLSSVKEDISRMCRDAIKAKTRGGSGDMNRIIMLFIQLATSLEENSIKSCRERDEMIKMLKDSSVAGSTPSKYKKKHNKIINDRRGMLRSNGTSYVNGGFDYGDYDASDREIRRRLSKLNKRALDSESETSDDPDLSEEDGRVEAENSDSETETDPDIHSEAGAGDLRGDGLPFVADEALDSEEREWGARMTKASLVPPVTRKYEVIDRYLIIADEEEVQRKMRVALPDDYAEKLRAQKNGMEESDMEIPEVKDYKPRKKLGEEVLEQEVYGIDPYTHNLLLDSMPGEEPEWPLLEKHLFIEEVLLRALNKQVRQFTGTGNTPMVHPLRPVLEEIQKIAEEGSDTRILKMCQGILKAMQSRPDDNYVAYRKGLGVVCNKEEGFGEEDFVVEFLGEVYPAWKWFEKQDGIRSLQKNSKDPAPEFYNIYLERPKGDRDGYDLVVVDAMHKANYASRICHSCRPNCQAKVTAVDGQYQIGIYTVRPIHYGEEITFDYNSVTESKEEYEASVCLCGSQVCRGSYLNLTGEGAFQKVLKECHGMLDRHQLMLEACEVNSVSEEDYIDLGRAGLGTCLLAGLPDWLIAYSARLVRFIDFERTKLPDEILKHNLEEKTKYFSEISIEVEKSDAEIQAEGVYNQRLQNLALTLDKVRYVMRCVFGDPKKAPPPLEKLSSEELVSLLWKGEGSLVEELVQCMAPHMEADLLSELKAKIQAHDPSGSEDLQRELQKSLLWLRDEIRDLPCTTKCRHDAAADLIHMYAYTKCFFKVRNYKSITSPPVYISPLDLGPKYADKLGSGFQEYSKTYGENYCLGQLICWHNQANADPDCNLSRARRGCVSLPDVSSFYAKSQKLSWKRVYGARTVKFMLARMVCIS
ncbi:histone-lysine N-methyltransferase ATXR3 isoform X2 [Magnolia sinica]|uniref:histone-lysine N-methyltransferase ATXR3 isoform X2 n=1 Tax=Magnolia sinica TaxID=86752 RepID=UPI002657E11D|nr:histone-lysine N-methyltransferase ATXR3 isoform X2 [Magnolia sinica]